MLTTITTTPHLFNGSNTRLPLMGPERPASSCGSRSHTGPVPAAMDAPVFEHPGHPTLYGTDNGTDNDIANLKLPPSSGLLTLITSLRRLLGTKGLASEDIDIAQVKQLMEAYQSCQQDWHHLALHDGSRNYSRNGIFNINGNANLLILVWTPGKSSAIHDHANAHCCMKILAGELTESLYDIPRHEGEKLVCKQNTTMRRDQVGYICDDIGLHKIVNLGSQLAVSLHLYTPPYALMYGCSTYEQGNGRKHHVDMSRYYSWQGKIMGRGVGP